MLRSLFFILLSAPAAFIIFVIVAYGWHYVNTRGMAYFGRSAAERARFREQLASVGRVLRPFFRPIGRRSTSPNTFAFAAGDVHLPSNVANRQSFDRAVDYKPQANDVFVATQMKCGTTWMQQLVYEIHARGRGDLSDDGHGHLAAVSPWLESYNGPSVADAPLVGPAQARVIKTHLPADLCPYDRAAKYIYLTRHPVSCFRSCLDFFRDLAGPFTPPEEALLSWFCSDRMWWGSWPDHVDGFWRWSQSRPNVLFLHFEELKEDLPAVVRRLVDFLECDLTENELSRVVEKGSFDYMKAHEFQFEMIPPNFFSAGSTFFKSGSAQRHEEATAVQAERIMAFCRDRLAQSPYPLGRFYPDVRGDEPSP